MKRSKTKRGRGKDSERRTKREEAATRGEVRQEVDKRNG